MALIDSRTQDSYRGGGLKASRDGPRHTTSKHLAGSSSTNTDRKSPIIIAVYNCNNGTKESQKTSGCILYSVYHKDCIGSSINTQIYPSINLSIHRFVSFRCAGESAAQIGVRVGIILEYRP